MITMQAFYSRLILEPGSADDYFQSLAVLTRASLRQLNRLKSDIAWYTWEVAKR